VPPYLVSETKRKEVVQCLERYWREVSEQFGRCTPKATLGREID